MNSNNIYINFNDLEFITNTINSHNYLKTLSFIPNFNNEYNLILITDITKYNEELKVNSTITHLNIYYVLTELSHNLCLLHNITKPFNLNLSNLNKFEYYISQNIKSLFEKNMPIMNLNLSNNLFLNNLFDKYELFKNTKTLTSLDISDNQLCNIMTICNIVKNNQQLQELNISYNKYDSQTDLYQLFKILKENKTINKLIIYGRSRPDTSNILYLLISILQIQNPNINVIY